jgi:TldD protein
MINQLLSEHKINENEVFNLLGSLSETGSEYSDLYFQHSVAESWVLDEGIVKDGSYNISHGVGARCVHIQMTLILKLFKGL